MAKIVIPIDTGFYESFSSPLASQSCVNLFPQRPQAQGAQSTGALFPTQGIDRFAEVVGICRGMYVFKGILFSVNGTSLFEIKENGLFTNKGEITGTGRVSISDNGVTMSIVVPSGDAYFFNSGTLSKIDNEVFSDFQLQTGGVTSVSSMDGYFIYTTANEFFWSSLVVVNDGRDFDARNFAAAEEKPDPIVRSIIVKNELLLGGTQTIEFYRTVGSGTTFQRRNGATISKGLAARFGIIEFDNSFVFLGSAVGEQPAIWRGSGGSAQKISTAAIDNSLSNFTKDEIENAFAFKYATGGNFFVGFTVGNKTYVYDASTLKWHERSTSGAQYRVNDMADAYGDILLGDNQGGLIGKINKNTYTEYSDIVTRSFSTSYLTNQGAPLMVNSVELKTESGVGLFKENKTGVNPVVSMSFSDDGGHTFIDSGDRLIGAMGKFATRQMWNRQGRIAVQRVLKFTVIEPIKVVFMNLWLNVKGGTDGR